MEDQKSANASEIDLLYILRPVSKLIGNLGRAIILYWKTLKRNVGVFVAIVLLSTLIGYSLRFVVPKAYKTNGIFVSHTIPGKYCAILLDNLDKLSGSRNNSILARKLNIDENMAGSIHSISTFASDDTSFAIDGQDSSLAVISVELLLTDMQYLDSIQSGLLNYLENNPYAIKRKNARIASLESLKSSLNKKILSLDTVKSLINSSIVPRGEGKGIILGEPINPVNVYQTEVLYSKELLKIDENLAMTDNIEVLQPFFRLNEPNFPRFNKILAYFFIFSIIAAFIFTPIFGKKAR